MDINIGNRKIQLICPTCGCENFICLNEDNSENLDNKTKYRCALCNRLFTKEEILEANQERIYAEVELLGEEYISEFIKDLAKIFK